MKMKSKTIDYIIKFIKKNNDRRDDLWEWSLVIEWHGASHWSNYKEARKVLQRRRKEHPDCMFKLIKIEETHTVLKI